MSINVLNSNGKVTAEHLKKTAYLYIRQSTLRQVFENTESTQRQYALRQRAVLLTPPAVAELRKTKLEIVAEIDRLLEHCTD